MADKEEKSTLGSDNAPPAQTAKGKESATEFYKKLKEVTQDKKFSYVRDAKLSDEEQKFVQERLYKMIDYTVKRHDWYVDQCHRLLQIGLALIASGGVIVALVATKLENLSSITQVFGWFFGISLYGTGLLLVHLYNRYMAGEHPYRKVADIHSWYFAYHFTSPLGPKLSGCEETAKKQVVQEAKYIEEYFSKFLTCAKERISAIREDIEQVAILLILQKYRAQQTKKMSQWLLRGVGFSFVVFMLFAMSFFLFPPSPRPSTGSSLTSTSPDPSPIIPAPANPLPTSSAPAPASTPATSPDLAGPTPPSPSPEANSP